MKKLEKLCGVLVFIVLFSACNFSPIWDHANASSEKNNLSVSTQSCELTFEDPRLCINVTWLQGYPAGLSSRAPPAEFLLLIREGNANLASVGVEKGPRVLKDVTLTSVLWMDMGGHGHGPVDEKVSVAPGLFSGMQATLSGELERKKLSDNVAGFRLELPGVYRYLVKFSMTGKWQLKLTLQKNNQDVVEKNISFDVPE